MLCAILLISSCKKYVEVDAPNDKLVTVTVFQANETAIAALTSVYAQMAQDNVQPYYIALETGFASDELTSYTESTILKQTYVNRLNSFDGSPSDFWQLGYSYIYQANAVWEGCNESTKLDPLVKKHLMAEALFIRAYWHFYLVNFFGDVPIVTTTDYVSNAHVKRSPKQQVYAQMVSDLISAENDLPVNYVALDSKTVAADRIRPNKYTASALLARVYLYSGKYMEAEQEASNVIAYNTLYGLADVGSVFLKTSKEAVWELAMPTPITSTANTFEGLNFILNSVPTIMQTNCSAISSPLLAAFENGDLRKVNWIGHYVDNSVSPAVDYAYPYKYTNISSTQATEYSVPFRLAEQYLIRAEARITLNNLKGGKDDLNTIRHRAGLGDTPANNSTDLINAVLQERQVELFAEYGHRWFDLKRTGKIDALMSNVALIKQSTWNSFQQLWPIPKSEIQINPNITQNPGYN